MNTQQLNDWLRSRAGLATIGGLLVLLALIALYWGLRPTPGTVVASEFPNPTGGMTCLPGRCDQLDAKFLMTSGHTLASQNGQKTIVWIGVPGQNAETELAIFDGDTGKDNAGNVVGLAGGNWDGGTTETEYILYGDPLRDGQGTQELGRWKGNASNPTSGGNGIWTTTSATMPNNNWFVIKLNNSAAASVAQSPSGHYYYRLEVISPSEEGEVTDNNYKLRSTGYLTMGHPSLNGTELRFRGGMRTNDDRAQVFPNFVNNYNTGASKYNGDWQFYFFVPSIRDSLEIWEGDFDRGSYDGTFGDTDDPNTITALPAFASAYARPEGIGYGSPSVALGIGAPPDNTAHLLRRVTPPVYYIVIDPNNNPLFINEEPSGNEEWERFVITFDPDNTVSNQVTDAHATSEIAEGIYGIHIQGLDMNNGVMMRVNFELCTDPNCGPSTDPEIPFDSVCPRTIGYWKNNVNKLFVDNRTQGVQESQESITAAVALIAKYSPLYRNSINVAAPAPITTANPLTLSPNGGEVNAILQKQAGNTMRDRALQQTLAAWLNMASGKLGANTYVELNLGSDTFKGTALEALLEAQNIILTSNDEALLERAKNIADQINNGNLGEDAPDTATCDQTKANIPTNKQPPAKKQDYPRPPRQPETPNNNPPIDPATCQNKRTNLYNIENPTNSPFYGIKFDYASGTEVKNGAFDTFKVVMPADQAAALTSVQLEAKAGEVQSTGTISGCGFNQGVPCALDPIPTSQDGAFGFGFDGADDNGDGTLTLNFVVYNYTDFGLSHATIALPDGYVPPTSGSYTSEFCPLD
jgi:hypothetical protein